MIFDVAVDPSGQWIASNGNGLRLWPTPEGKPFQTLPYDEFLNRLRDLTNMRVVANKNSLNGYDMEYAPFPGWEHAPTW